jgi:predicted hotdog family 3-hydroxylacyl-ACP dehydratase
MSQDWPVDKLIDYLPHRPPMIWIDRVTEVGADYRGITGTCRVQLKPDALYMSNSKELRASAAIEFTAQAFGYIKAAYQEIHQFSNPPQETYLTGVRYCYANFTALDMAQAPELEIRLKVKREMLPLTFVYGEIFSTQSPELLAKVEIQVYVA